MKERPYAKNKYIVDGSAVRKINTQAPDSYEESMSEWLEKRERRQKQKRGNEARRRRLQREEETRMHLGTFLFLTASILFMSYTCITYLRVRGDVTNLSKKIAIAESEIVKLKNDNAIAYHKVNATVDLSYFYRVATKELGIVHPKSNQIIEYEQTKSDFVNQYAPIPEVKEKNVMKRVLKNVKKK